MCRQTRGHVLEKGRLKRSESPAVDSTFRLLQFTAMSRLYGDTLVFTRASTIDIQPQRQHTHTTFHEPYHENVGGSSNQGD